MTESDLGRVGRFVDPVQPETRPRRGEVLALLRESPVPLSISDVAAATGLHINTIRFHLEGLVADGLADRSTEARDVPGRPRILYTADGEPPGPRSYQLLAEMLTSLVAALPDRRRQAIAAGDAWGRHLVERAKPSHRTTADEAVARLVTMLDATGFQPNASPAPKRGVDISLLHCPFREVAEQHQDVVCSVHLGLIQGALAELRAPLDAVSLEPFVAPHRCVARLQTSARRTSST
jgi:predicted ArsR family transcriptional regulator